jgi:hypothetical protein
MTLALPVVLMWMYADVALQKMPLLMRYLREALCVFCPIQAKKNCHEKSGIAFDCYDPCIAARLFAANTLQP